jgi:chromosome segregation ATPase
MKIKSVNDITDDLLKTVEANVVSDFIEEELRTASEKFAEEKNKLQTELEEAKQLREELNKNHEELKTKFETVEKTLAELEEEKTQRQAEARFNERMALLDEEYELNDEDREVLASDIKDMNNEDFQSYQKKIKVLLKDKTKAIIEANKAEAAQKAEETTKQNEEVKASDEDEVVETAVDAGEKENAEIPNSIQAEEETLIEKYKKAFDFDQFETN